MQKDLSFQYNCPYCGAVLDSLTSFDEIKVRHDDFTICFVCAGLCNWVVQEDMWSLRVSTDTDIARAKETGLYGQIEELIDFIKSKDSRIIRPGN